MSVLLRLILVVHFLHEIIHEAMFGMANRIIDSVKAMLRGLHGRPKPTKVFDFATGRQMTMGLRRMLGVRMLQLVLVV